MVSFAELKEYVIDEIREDSPSEKGNLWVEESVEFLLPYVLQEKPFYNDVVYPDLFKWSSNFPEAEYYVDRVLEFLFKESTEMDIREVLRQAYRDVLYDIYDIIRCRIGGENG